MVVRAGMVAGLLCAVALTAAQTAHAQVSVRNIGGPYDAVAIEFNGPPLDEASGPNPFADYRLDVTFGDGQRNWIVPGYFAGCANAADTGCTRGRLWRAHFVPSHGGAWSYSVSFRTGTDIVGAGGEGQAIAGIDGAAGRFSVSSRQRDPVRARGLLRYTGESYYRWSGDGSVFYKFGVDAPENMLAFSEFDATPNFRGYRKDWSPHLQDYDARSARPYLWDGQRGRALLGMFNYLHAEGVNSVSMLLWNVGGDDRNVFPHLLRVGEESYAAMEPRGQWYDGVARDRFDLSKMAQWARALSYADALGMHLHFKLQETENDDFMDGGELGRERRIYIREMLARFNHFLAVTWNIGEENTQSPAAIGATSRYIDALDPYEHAIVLHTYPHHHERYRPLLGEASVLNGLSLQGALRDFSDVRADVVKWIDASREAGRPLVVGYDESGGAQASAPVDPSYPADRLPGEIIQPASRDDLRQNLIWGALTAGGNGVELYYGYQSGCSDLTCQDHRTRAHLWRDGVNAVRFFERHVGEHALSMRADDALTREQGDFIFADMGRIYVIYRRDGDAPGLPLFNQSGAFDVRWYDALNGGELQQGSVATVEGGAVANLGDPPEGGSGEWAILVRRTAE